MNVDPDTGEVVEISIHAPREGGDCGKRVKNE